MLISSFLYLLAGLVLLLAPCGSSPAQSVHTELNESAEIVLHAHFDALKIVQKAFFFPLFKTNWFWEIIC